MRPDIDTSANFDPSPTSAELLAIRDEMNARVKSGDGPIRVIRSANLLTRYWRQDTGFMLGHRGFNARSPQVMRCETLAATGEHLCLERVGLVVEVTEVTP